MKRSRGLWCLSALADPLPPTSLQKHETPLPSLPHTHTKRGPACKAPAKPTALFKNLQLAPSDSTNGA